jgi:PPM family protein phosphatase
LSPNVEIAIRSDPGRDPHKQDNEDASGQRTTPIGLLVVVCDGMGGHAGGREASHAALEAIFRTFDAAREDSPRQEVLRLAITHANEVVFHQGSGLDGTGRPGSTVVAILVHAGGTEVAHVGDSRCYRVHQGHIDQITKDHSMVQEMVDAGLLAQEQAQGHPDANRITRALGSRFDVNVEVRPSPVEHEAGDAFVLCSDGLSDMLPKEEILRVVASSPAEQAAGQLVELANAHGGHDNITVAIVRTRESAELGPDDGSSRVAKTVAQTGVEQGKTLVQGPVPDVEGQQAPVVALIPSAPRHDLLPHDLPSSPPSSPRRRPTMAFVGLGVGLLLVLAGLFAGAYGAYLHESGHHEHHGVGSVGLPPMSAAPTGVRVLEPSTATAVATVHPDEPTEPLRPLGGPDGGASSNR